MFVAAGSLLGAWLLPRPPTPANVARSYTQAVFDRDWEEAWSLTCQHRRSEYRDFATYAELSDQAFTGYVMPERIDILVRTAGGGRGSAAMGVAVRDRAGGAWHVGDMTVVLEHGNLRGALAQDLERTDC